MGKKKTCGPNKDDSYHHPPPGEKYLVEWNRSKQPVGVFGGYLKKKLSSLAHRGELFPIDITWNEQKEESFKDAMNEITIEFDLSGNPDAHRIINAKINKLWRKSYGDLKKTLVDAHPECSEAEIVDNVQRILSSK